MKKEQTKSFILEFPLRVNPKEEKELLSRFESARQLYNSALGEAKKRVILIKQSTAFNKARKINKEDKQRNIIFKEIKEFYCFDDYSIQKFLTKNRHEIVNNLDAHTVQKIATRAFRAAEGLLYGKARKLRFKSYGQLKSIEGKSNDTSIRWRNNKIEWNKLSLSPIIKINDSVIQHGLNHNVKYCRIIKRIIKGKNRFYVQLVLEGNAYIKPKNQMGNGVVAFDFGPSTIAITSIDSNNNFDSRLLQFCEELDLKQKRIKKYQRKIDRQRRANNPNNYNEDKTIKKGKKLWKKSKRQIETQNELNEIYRKETEHRKSLHGKLANETLRMGNVFKTEDVSLKWLQKNFGKSIGNRAPGTFINLLNRKAESAGGLFVKFSTRTTALSQNCLCGRKHKQLLSDRVHDCECELKCQRDLFSSYLAIFVEKDEDDIDILQVDQARKYWYDQGVDKLLQATWRNTIQSMSSGNIPASFGSLKDCQSQNGSLVEEGRAKFKIRDVVPSSITIDDVESPKENKVFPLEPTGF